MLLDSEEARAYRRRWISILRLAQRYAPELYEELLSCPPDLPDLSRLRPPGGNTRPQGIEQSHHARRARGELPEIY
jgi:hypothetical protein